MDEKETPEAFVPHVEKPVTPLVRNIRRTFFIVVLIALALAFLGTIGSVVQIIFMKIDHPRHTGGPEEQTTSD